MKEWEETLKCGTCGKKMGIVVMSSIGSPHQFLGGATCLDCLPRVLEKTEKEHPELKGRIKKIREWLKTP